MIKAIEFKQFTKVVFYFFVFFPSIFFAQLAVNAGSDTTICPNIGASIGGTPTASGGLAPYKYSWTPVAGLNNSTIANPITTPEKTTTYTLTVTDDTGAVKTDEIIVTMNYIKYVSAGDDLSLCVTDSVFQIGGIYNYNNIGVAYSWSPGLTLNDSLLPQPTATINHDITYTLTATTSGCATQTDFVTISFIAVPPIDACATITINEGENTTLSVTGGFYYYWSPENTLTYPYTATPNAEPITTTLYQVVGSDPSKKCFSSDTVTVIVLQSENIVIYNTFTPNHDGNNDTWYIGNIYKFPNNIVEIYNRYGKLVYKKFQYNNTWDGKAYGDDLPAGTYFYNVDLGDGKSLYHGTLTIIRG